MSINKLVSVNNVIINLLDDLALDHTKYKPMFTNWAIWAEKQIGSFYQYEKKFAVLDICGCHAELPCDAKYLQRAIMGDRGCDCTDLYNSVCGNLLSNVNVTSGSFDSTSFLVVDLPASATAESGTFSFGFVGYDIQDNKIIFKQNLDGQKVTIQYLGLKCDCDGIPLVGENHLEALAEYCMYKFRRRNPKSGIQLGMIRDHKQAWEQLAARARGDDAEVNDSDQKRIVALLHDPYAGKGLPLVPSAGYGYSNNWTW